MGTNRKRLVAAAASMVVAVGLAGCGGDSDSGSGPGSNQEAERTDAVKGGTIYSLETSVTQSLDPQRTYTGRDLSNQSRLVYRSLVDFPKGVTDNIEGQTPIPDLATYTTRHVRLDGSNTGCDGTADAAFSAGALGFCAVATGQKGADLAPAGGTVRSWACRCSSVR